MLPRGATSFLYYGLIKLLADISLLKEFIEYGRFLHNQRDLTFWQLGF